MSRNLVQGNIAEAMFRLWVEKHPEIFTRTTVIQTGYNPRGIVQVTDKQWLPEDSDPDFALAAIDAHGRPGRIVYGISVNAHQRLYGIQSTSGGYCSVRVLPGQSDAIDESCPHSFTCFTSRRGDRLWYNRPNIENDYPRFQAKVGATDTILVVFVSRRPAAVHKWLKQQPEPERVVWESAIWDYLKNGTENALDKEQARRFARRLEYGHWVTRPILKEFGLRWFLLSEIQNKKVPFWITGGLSDNGRPPLKYCLPESESHSESELIAFLQGLSVND